MEAKKPKRKVGGGQVVFARCHSEAKKVMKREIQQLREAFFEERPPKEGG